MDKNLRACCGSYCGACQWREKIGCRGCKANCGRMFWGECDIARCCGAKGYDHCGECPSVPCEQLRAAFLDPEHGDDGARLRNLLGWRAGRDTYELLRNPAQEKAGALCPSPAPAPEAAGLSAAVEACLSRYSGEVRGLFLALRSLVLGAAEGVEEKMWARLPSYYAGESFVRLIPCKDHVNVEARAIAHSREKLSGYRLTPKGMLQVFPPQPIPEAALGDIFRDTLSGGADGA